MKKLFGIVTYFFSILTLNAQTTFLENVKVEYEKVVYIRQMIKELWGAEAFESWGANVPQSTSYYFDFTGNTNKSVYIAGKESVSEEGWWNHMFGSKNVVITDYKNKTTISHKPVFDENFLVEDSLLNIKWKFTADTRTIAGFECRKALGILNDSIAIFAFYTDDILVTGGPERIQGLPGLILGVGIPRLHTTWFATKVEINSDPINIPQPPKKAKKVSYKSLVQELDRVLKNFGTEGAKMVINFMI